MIVTAWRGAASSLITTYTEMPMFREDDMGPRNSRDSDSQCPDSAPIPIQTPPGMGRWLSHRLSEESIRTELCEGPLPDTPPKPATPEEAVSRAVSDRAELIERLKRGESPTWIPNRHVCFRIPKPRLISNPWLTPVIAGIVVSSDQGIFTAQDTSAYSFRFPGQLVVTRAHNHPRQAGCGPGNTAGHRLASASRTQHRTAPISTPQRQLHPGRAVPSCRCVRGCHSPGQ